MVYANNIITHKQNSHLIAIEPDGSFSCQIPLIHPQDVLVRILKINKSVYLEPGETTFEFIDFSKYATPRKFRKKQEQKSLFMGGVAKINSDLLAMDSISYFDYYKIQKKILNMTGDTYKAYCLEIMNKENKVLENFTQNNQVSKKALQIKKMQIQYNAYTNILSFNRYRNQAYCKKHKIPRNQREIPLKEKIFKPTFYDFIKNNPNIKKPISVVSGNAYNRLINKLRFSKSIRRYSIEKKQHEVVVFDSITKKNKTINASVLKDLVTGKILNFKTFDDFQKFISDNFKNCYNLQDDFATEIMFAQSKF